LGEGGAFLETALRILGAVSLGLLSPVVPAADALTYCIPFVPVIRRYAQQILPPCQVGRRHSPGIRPPQPPLSTSLVNLPRQPPSSANSSPILPVTEEEQEKVVQKNELGISPSPSLPVQGTRRRPPLAHPLVPPSKAPIRPTLSLSSYDPRTNRHGGAEVPGHGPRDGEEPEQGGAPVERVVGAAAAGEAGA
jgi:hypothetical protein